MTALATTARRVSRRGRSPGFGAGRSRPSGVRSWLAAELLAGALGFAASVFLARRLGPSAFARVEFAAAVAGWLLVLVRGGIDIVVYREAARRPRLIRRLTDLLIGLRLACAVAGYAMALLIAGLVGPDRGAVVAVAGLALFPTALAADVAPRARGRFGWVALVQAIRAIGYALLIFATISGSNHALRAAWCAVAAEAVAAVLFGLRHVGEFDGLRPRFRRRAWHVLAGRGALAGLARLGRVGLFTADVLALGAIAAADLGPFAASRRLVFGLVTLGLIVPASMGPILSRAWAVGALPTRRAIGRSAVVIGALALPASAGLILLADRIMPALFGAAYGQAGPLLAANAARLVPLLLASLYQAALVACRRESEAMVLVLAQVALAAVVLPLAALRGGSLAVGWCLVPVEAVGAAGAWLLLHRLRAAPRWQHGLLGPLAACGVMGMVCHAVRSWPLAVVCGLGALSYGLALVLFDHRWRFRVLG